MESDFLHIGKRIVWGNNLPFGLTREDRRQHLYLVGQTGTGKSTLLTQLIQQDIENHEGCAFIDPHGDSARYILTLIPPARIDDVVLIEPSDLEHPVAINPFYHVPKDERPLVASNLVAAFKHLWSDSWGPRLEYLLYNTLAAILDAPDHLRPTILSIPRMFVDDSYRLAVVAHIIDPQVRQFWEGEFATWSERFRAEIISPVQNKVGALVSAPALRNILGQWRPSIDLVNIMESKKILIVNLAKGEIGEDKANMIGSLLVASLEAAAMRRSRVSENKRSDFYLYIDEFHNFGTEAFIPILSESRKMHLCLTIAHQFLTQIPENILDAVFGNVGSIISFRVGAEDAERLSHELTEYSPMTLRGLERGHVCVRLLKQGEASQPFTGNIDAALQHGNHHSDKVRSQVRQRYSSSRSAVEKNINSWFNRVTPNFR